MHVDLVKMTLGLVILIGALLFSSRQSGNVMAAADHDFSDQAWNPGGEICQPCHTPHVAKANGSDTPLWNHEMTQAMFLLYASSTMDAKDIGQPSGRSRLCLSCHDGSVAIDAFGDAGGAKFIGEAVRVDTDLRDDHPIAFTYDDALAAADGELYRPSSTDSGLGGTIETDLLFEGKMECSSCHDVHNSANLERLLVKSNARSRLCLTCHAK